MPLKKRVLYDPAAYHRKDVFEEPTSDTFLQDHNMSKMLGTMNQLAYLSSFALEIFQNLAVLSEDLSERIKLSSVRTTALFDNLRAVDREVSSIDDDSHISAITGLSAYLQSREMFTPQLFNKATNYSSIATQYRICRPPPQLWRIEVFTHEDCFRNYSNPGFFFQEWIRTEIVRQQLKKEEKRKTKALRKLQRQERKKQKEAAEAEEEELLAGLYLEEQRPSLHSNVSLSGVTDKHKRNKSILSANREETRHKASAEKKQELSPSERRSSPPHNNHKDRELAQRERDHSNELLEGQSDPEAGVSSRNNKDREKEKKKGLKGLSKLFGRSKKDKLAPGGEPNEEHSGEESETEEEAPQLSKAESLSMQILGGGEREREKETRDREREREREKEKEKERERDRLSDSDDAAPRAFSAPSHASAAARPKSYVDELTAATASSRRMSIIRDQSHLSVSLNRHFTPSGELNTASNTHTHSLGGLQEYSNEYDEEEQESRDQEEHHLPIQLNLKAAKKNKKAPVTMKIGSKFLSASKTKTLKPEKSESTVPELHHLHRRGSASARLHPVAEESDPRGSGEFEASGHRLIRPTSSPPTASTHKRASFSLPNKRQSFALAGGTSSTAGMFDRAKPWAAAAGAVGSDVEEDDESSEMHGNSNLRRRSLLSMLQNEVFEELYAAGGGEEVEEVEIDEFEGEKEPADDEEEEEEEDEQPYGSSPGKSVDMTEDDVDLAEEEEFAEEEEDGMEDDLIEEEDAPADEEDFSEGPDPNDGSGPDAAEESRGPSDGGGGSPPESPKVRRRSVQPRPPPPPPGGGPASRPGPPPPPPAPMRSALTMSVLGSLKAGGRESLKKVAPPPEVKVDDRAHLLRSIQLGSAQLKGAPSKAAAPFQKIAVQQNEAVAAILANRSKIAGSDSESSDDSDSDYTDDDY